MSDKQTAQCTMEVWVRSKSGLRVRSAIEVHLGPLLDLTMEKRGEAITQLLVGAMTDCQEKVTEMDRRYEEALKRNGLPRQD